MAHARTLSMVVLGVEGHAVEVEAHLSGGLPAVAIVGLPDAAVAESRDRARSAILNAGLPWPSTRLTIGLSPAWLPKSGSGLDLAIALAVLAAEGEVPAGAVADSLIVGELGLDGRVRPVRGVLVAAMTASRSGAGSLVVPRANVDEARLVPGIPVLGASTLRGVVLALRGESPDEGDDAATSSQSSGEPMAHPGRAPGHTPDLADVRGHAVARYAMELAAAGGHHVALVGPPGVGKTLLAERLPGLLPDLDDSESLEVTAVHSVVGSLASRGHLIRRPPLCAPHHTVTYAAMVGGGSGRSPKVGLVSQAHRGVLFLDEAPEFAPQVLEALRQPMESGLITVDRVGFTARLPSRFQLVLAANPCPCGRAGTERDDCTCSSLQRRRYLARLSGPLLDRVDLRLVVGRPTPEELSAGEGESTAAVAARVALARERSAQRLASTPWRTNAEVPGAQLRRDFAPTSGASAALDAMARDPLISARGLDRVLRVAWTLADVRGLDRPDRREVMEAAGLRDGAGRWAA